MSALATYDARADGLTSRHLRLSPERIYAPVRRFLPKCPERIADIGAGPGRDARWLCNQGHRVTAVEPARSFRTAGRTAAPDALWINAHLPELSGVDGPFDLILVNAVWHHLAPERRAAALRRLRDLAAPGGRLILSLRHGPPPEGMESFPIDPEATFNGAGAAGWEPVFRDLAPAVQRQNRAAGVRWSWLVLTAREEKDA